MDLECKVFYPHTGTHYVLVYNTHSKGNCLIVGKTKASVEKIFETIAKKNRDIKCKSFFFADFVGPSEEQKKQIKECLFKREVVQFWSAIAYEAMDYFEETKQVPNGLKTCCDNYQCDECFSTGYKPQNESVVDFFLRNKDEYYKNKKDPKHPFADRFYSAPPSGEIAKQTFAIWDDFGHHRDGYVYDKAFEPRESYAFFYQNPRYADSSNILLIQEKIEAERKKVEEKLQAEIKNRKIAFEKNKFKNLQKYFNI